MQPQQCQLSGPSTEQPVVPVEHMTQAAMVILLWLLNREDGSCIYLPHLNTVSFAIWCWRGRVLAASSKYFVNRNFHSRADLACMTLDIHSRTHGCTPANSNPRMV
jgi:hypothetical protein